MWGWIFCIPAPSAPQWRRWPTACGGWRCPSVWGDDYRVVEARLPDILQTLLSRPIEPWEIWNINFPACAPEELRGIREGCRPSALQFYHNAYRPTGLEDGGARLELTGTLEQNPEPGTDMDAVLRNYIAVGKISSAVLKASRAEG